MKELRVLVARLLRARASGDRAGELILEGQLEALLDRVVVKEMAQTPLTARATVHEVRRAFLRS